MVMTLLADLSKRIPNCQRHRLHIRVRQICEILISKSWEIFFRCLINLLCDHIMCIVFVISKGSFFYFAFDVGGIITRNLIIPSSFSTLCCFFIFTSHD